MVRGSHLLLLAALLAAPGACGDAFSSQLPEKKQEAGLELRPNYVELGETVDLQAVVSVPHDLNYVSQYEFGDGLDITSLDYTGSPQGCSEVDLSQFELSAEGGHIFAVCLTVEAQLSAQLGQREVSFDVESNGTPVIGRGSFLVVPPLLE